MVSFQKLPELSDKSPRKRSETHQDHDQFENLPIKKRRSEESTIRVEEFLEERRWRSHSTKPLLIDVDLCLETPLRSAPWPKDRNTLPRQTQNLCSTIRTTQKTTSSKDPISLDLGLNLLCSAKSSSHQDKEGGLFKPKHSNFYKKNFHMAIDQSMKEVNAEEEMVAKACMRCHMLVMMCKSSPSCPNCKFMHPPDHNAQSTLLIKARPSNNASSCVS